MKILPSVAFLLILGIAYSAPAEALPFQFHNYVAHYTLRYDGIPFGKSTTKLLVNDPPSHYDLCIINQTTLPFLHGTVEECSNGTLTSNQVIPQWYDYYYQRGDTKEHIRIDFDWKKHLATMTTDQAKNSQWHIAIPDGTQDKISYQLELRRGLANGQTSFSFPIADGGKLKTYGFSVAEHKGNVIKVHRNPIPHKENVTLWFHSNWNYVITKVKQNKHIVDIGTAVLDSVTW